MFRIKNILIKISSTNRHVNKQFISYGTKTQNTTKFTNTLNIFDRESKRIQKNLTCSNLNYREHEYIKDEIGFRVADRVFDIKRSFDTILDLGCQRGHVSKHLTKVNILDLRVDSFF